MGHGQHRRRRQALRRPRQRLAGRRHRARQPVRRLGRRPAQRRRQPRRPTAGSNNAPDTHPSYEDRAYGGAGRDVLIANTGGDRLIDWAGEFNSYIVPFAPFGLGTVSRMLQPRSPSSCTPCRQPTAPTPRAPPTSAATRRATASRSASWAWCSQQDFAWQRPDRRAGRPAAGQHPRRRARRAALGRLRRPGGHAASSPTAAAGTPTNGALQVTAASLERRRGERVPRRRRSCRSTSSCRPRSRSIKPTAGWKAQRYVIFDYQSTTDFKFAGIDVSTQQAGHGPPRRERLARRQAGRGHRRREGRHVLQHAGGGERHQRHAGGRQQAGVHAHLSAAHRGDRGRGLCLRPQPRLRRRGLRATRAAASTTSRVQILPPQLTFDQTETFNDGVADLFTGGTERGLERQRAALQRDAAGGRRRSACSISGRTT